MMPSGAGSTAVTAAHFDAGRELAPIARRAIGLRQIVAHRVLLSELQMTG